MSDRSQRHRYGRRAAAAAACSAAVLALAGCAQGNDQNSLEPAGPNAEKIHNLFTPFFWIAVVIGIAVIAGTFYVAVRFRERHGEQRNPKQTHGSTALEVGWTIVPALILAVMAVPTVATIFDLAEKPQGADVVHVNVIAKQWFWEFEYCESGNPDCGVASGGDSGIALVTANELHIPAGTPVALNLTSPADGVIHSFWLPNLAGKRDAVPGRNHFLKIEADEPGEWRGQCAEYCGLSHANMRLRVIAQPRDEFDAWMASQQAGVPAAQQATLDGAITEWGCTGCHAFNDFNANVRIGPNLTHVGDRSTFASGTYETGLQNLTDWVYDAPSMKPMDHLSFAMPSFRKSGMTQAEAREIATFLCETATDPEATQRCLGSDQ